MIPNCIQSGRPHEGSCVCGYEVEFVSYAREIARRAHEGQKRRYSGDPYIVHPYRVVLMLDTEDPEIRAAAWLHDVVEDSDIMLKELRRGFGERVARIVDALTGDKKKLETAPWEALYIKCADRIDNLLDWDPRPPKRYVEEAKWIAMIADRHAEARVMAAHLKEEIRRFE